MGRHSVGLCVVAIALGIACQPAYAGGRKSSAAARDDGGLDETFTSHQAHSLTVRHDAFGSAAVRPFDVSYSSVTEKRFTNAKENDNSKAPTGDRKMLTLFHFNSRFGDVAVQPVFNGMKGLQLSVGF
jgi:hypothetical protein